MIYFLRAGDTGHVKIGWTKSEGTLKRRIGELQGGQPFRLTVVRTLPDAPRWVEVWLHGFFSGVRMIGEWFTFQPEMLSVVPPKERPPRPVSHSKAFNAKSEQIALRLPREDMALAQARAAASGQRVSAVLREAIARGLRLMQEPQETPDA